MIKMDREKTFFVMLKFNLITLTGFNRLRRPYISKQYFFYCSREILNNFHVNFRYI